LLGLVEEKVEAGDPLELLSCVFLGLKGTGVEVNEEESGRRRMLLFIQALEYLSAGKLTEKTAGKVTSFLIGEVQGKPLLLLLLASFLHSRCSVEISRCSVCFLSILFVPFCSSLLLFLALPSV